MLTEKIKKELIEQRNSKFKGNIYHYSQLLMKQKKYLKQIHLYLKVMMLLNLMI